MYVNRVHSNGDTTHGGPRDKDKAGLGQCLYRQAQRETARVPSFFPQASTARRDSNRRASQTSHDSRKRSYYLMVIDRFYFTNFHP